MIFLEYINAFWVGGLICVVGQLLIDLTPITPARVMVISVTGGVFLGAIGLYQPLVDFAGSGATVPLWGFGNLLASGVKEAVEKDGLIGALTGGLTASSAGITSAISLGVLAALLKKPGDKS